MPDTPNLLLFAAAALALAAAPGPAVLYIVTRSLDGGRRAGFVSVLGIAVGASLHVVAAAVGLSALLASSAVAFGIVKYAGAAYLVYLGVRKLASSPSPPRSDSTPPQALFRLFLDGVLVNALNPKTALFFLSFLPQFVVPERGEVSAQVLGLGLLFIGVALLSDSAYALLAGSFGRWLKESRRFLRAQHYLSGAVYLLLGVGAAFSGSSKPA